LNRVCGVGEPVKLFVDDSEGRNTIRNMNASNIQGATTLKDRGCGAGTDLRVIRDPFGEGNPIPF